jgi:hypothetical protein
MPQTRVVPNPRGSVIIDRRLLGKQRVSAGGGHDERRHPQSRAEETRTRRNSPGRKVVPHAALAIAIDGGAGRE